MCVKQVLFSLVCLVLCIFTIGLNAQLPCWGDNCVSNAGFESYRSCQENTTIQKSTLAWIDHSLNVNDFPPSMDYFNLYCKKKAGFYAEIPEDNPPYMGSAMLGGFMLQADAKTWNINRRVHKEYAYCALNGHLSVGKTYRLQFYVKFAQSRQFRNKALDQIGAVLSEDDPTQFFEQSSYRGPRPMAQSKPGQLLKDSSTWVLISHTFVADKPYKYLMLGHFYQYDENAMQSFFKTNDTYNAYYLFDEVALQELREEPPSQQFIIDRVCDRKDTGRVIIQVDCGLTQIIQRLYSPYPDTTVSLAVTCIRADTGVFIKRFRTLAGCDSVHIRKVSYCDPDLPKDNIALIYTPTVFSPNGDGINDHFMIFTKPTGLKIKQLAVYTYWGQKTYSMENFEVTNDNVFGWDGLFKGAVASPGTYVWVLSYEDLDGNIKLKRGTVALIR